MVLDASCSPSGYSVTSPLESPLPHVAHLSLGHSFSPASIDSLSASSLCARFCTRRSLRKPFPIMRLRTLSVTHGRTLLLALPTQSLPCFSTAVPLLTHRSPLLRCTPPPANPLLSFVYFTVLCIPGWGLIRRPATAETAPQLPSVTLGDATTREFSMGKGGATRVKALGG